MIGVLLVNLGTPLSYSPGDVRRYLNEFLTDGRVIDIPWFPRQLLVRGVIVPRRYRESASNYKVIWREEGSPLMIYGRSVQTLLQKELGDEVKVELAMRYQEPSIEKGLNRLQECSQIIVLPLFPQYASATTGSVHQKVMECISKWQTIPALNFINSYPVQEKMIEAFCSLAKEQNVDAFDHLLISFHGLPERQLKKADRHDYCLKSRDCCKKLCQKNRSCYSAQCHQTAYAIASGLGLADKEYSISFQSRLGKDPWIQPYTSDVLKKLAEEGAKKVLVMCPAFVCDCIETIHEIGVEYQEEFEQWGGEKLQLVTGLNNHPLWIEALKELVEIHMLKSCFS